MDDDSWAKLANTLMCIISSRVFAFQNCLQIPLSSLLLEAIHAYQIILLSKNILFIS